MLSLILLSLAAAAAPADGAAVRCPARLSPAVPLPRGARLLGRPAAGARLAFASVTNDGIDAVDDSWTLAEVEPDDSVTARGVRTDTTAWAATDGAPATLACRYGRYDGANRGDALLLLPLPAAHDGECRFTVALTAKDRPKAMACTVR
jgi:hypothetical protein